MADVTYLGFGATDGYGPNTGAERVLLGVGSPELDDSIEVQNEGRVLIYPDGNVGPDVTYGAKGTPIFDDTIEVQNEGMVLQDLNSNSDVEVELGGTGTPLFPGVAVLLPLFITPDPYNFQVNKGFFNPGEATFFTTPILGPTYPVTNDK